MKLRLIAFCFSALISLVSCSKIAGIFKTQNGLNCGEAASLHIIELLGGKGQSVAASNKEQISLLKIKNILEGNQLEVAYFNGAESGDFILSHGDLCILHLKSAHFVVAKKVAENLIYWKDQDQQACIKQLSEISSELTGHGLRIIGSTSSDIFEGLYTLGSPLISRETSTNGILTFSIDVYNPLSEDVELRKVHTPCTCLAVSNISGTFIPANSAKSVDIQFTAPPKEGVYSNKLIIESSQNNVAYDLSVKVESGRLISKDFLNYGVLLPGETKEEILKFQGVSTIQFVSFQGEKGVLENYSIQIVEKDAKWKIILTLDKNYQSSKSKKYQTFFLVMKLDQELIKIPVFVFC